jgi:hypothetical protein
MADFTRSWVYPTPLIGGSWHPRPELGYFPSGASLGDNRQGDLRAADLTSQHIERYILRRQREEASNASINRELQVLKRALAWHFSAIPQIARAPYIGLLPENNLRKGFPDDTPYLKLRNELPDYCSDVSRYRSPGLSWLTAITLHLKA